MSALEIFIDIMIMVAIPLLIIIGAILITRSETWKRKQMLRASRRRRSISKTESSEERKTDHLLNIIAESDIEVLMCYSCDDVFDSSEEKCNNCGASRPNCMICFQDLRPTEKEDVVQLPCCDIYVHEDHILTWLKQNQHFPNCRKNLSKWFKELSS